MFKYVRFVLSTLISVFALTVFAVMPVSSQTESSGCAAVNAGSFNINTIHLVISNDFFAGDILNLSFTNPSAPSYNQIWSNSTQVSATSSGTYTLPASGTFSKRFRAASASNNGSRADWIVTCTPAPAPVIIMNETLAESSYLPFVNDGRINNYDPQAPTIIYRYYESIDLVGFDVYTVEGILSLRITSIMINDAGEDSEMNTLIASSENDQIYVSRLANGNIQVASLMDNGKTYILILDPVTFLQITSYEIEPAGE